MGQVKCKFHFAWQNSLYESTKQWLIEYKPKVDSCFQDLTRMKFHSWVSVKCEILSHAQSHNGEQNAAGLHWKVIFSDKKTPPDFQNKIFEMMCWAKNKNNKGPIWKYPLILPPVVIFTSCSSQLNGQFLIFGVFIQLTIFFVTTCT